MRSGPIIYLLGDINLSIVCLAPAMWLEPIQNEI